VRYIVSSERAPTVAARAVAARNWTRLGDQIITWSTNGRGLGRAARRAGGLLLVTQVGRSFQHEHPEVRPILDHGRHLVVDGGEHALRPRTTVCWRVEPLPADRVVVDVSGVGARPVDRTTQDLLAQLSSASYQQDVVWLAGLTTRHSLSSGFTTAATWAAGRLASLGYAVTRTPVSVGSGQSENVIGERVGTGERKLVIATAHLDSVNLSGGPTAPAPGADDNASGSAAVLELARVFATGEWAHDLRVILFGGEEQGLHGSTQYVASLPPTERARIKAVLNMDMIATRNTPTPTVLLEGAAVSSGLIDDLAVAAATYTGLRVETSLSPFGSDHVPFIGAGIPAVLTIEGGDSANGNIHTANDVLAHLDYGFAHDILRMNLAAVAGWLGAVVPRRQPAGPVVASQPGHLDIFAVSASGRHLIHKSWDGSAWHPTVTGFDDLGGTVAG
jgi:hypothetical protein